MPDTLIRQEAWRELGKMIEAAVHGEHTLVDVRLRYHELDAASTAHIDALTAAVREAAETLEPYSRDKVLAVLRGES